MTSSDNEPSELHETGDAFLAFFASWILAAILLTIVFWQYFSIYGALAAALPLALIFAWLLSLNRAARRIFSGIVQGLFRLLAIFL